MYPLGASVPLRFRSQGASAQLVVRLPDGSIDPAAPTPGLPTDGEFVVQYAPAAPGRYTVTWTDNAGGALADVFNVGDVSVALCSLDDAKRHLNMELGVHVDDDELRGHIEAATGAIERHRNEVVAVRPFTATVTTGQVLPRGPVVRVTAAAAERGGTVLDVADWRPDPATGLVVTPRVSGRVVVDYIAGYPIVPPDFVLAAEIIAAHLWETQRMSTMGVNIAEGTDQYLTPSGLGYAIPNRAVQLLGGRPPVIA